VAASASISEIRALDVGPSLPLNGGALEDAVGAAVVAGSIVGFVPGLEETPQRDVLESLLLAQLAANAKADRYREPAAWFRSYRGVIEQIGWVVESSRSSSRYLPQVSRFFASTVVADVLKPKVSQEEWDAVEHALQVIGSSSSPVAQVLFECPSHSGGLGNFQVAVGSNVDGETRLCIAQITFNVNRHVTRLFSEEFTPDSQLQVGFLSLVQNESIYAQLRSSIAAKVQERFERFVVTVPASLRS
jgi:hypothetical protein